jgi:UDP-N-acetylglucosamine 1-carboxyvinyltransferase
MGTFKIEGGHALKGEIIPQGAKNEALQVISAVLLTSDEVIIKNIPVIRDVKRLIELLGGLGVKVNQITDESYSFQADDIDLDYLNSTDFRKKARSIRGSVMIIGPLLAQIWSRFPTFSRRR